MLEIYPIIDKILRVLKSFLNDTNSYLQPIYKKEEETIEALVTSQLYNDGVRGDGSKIAPPYAMSTIRRKLKNNQPTDRVTLKDSGKFHASIYAEALNDAIYIDSNDPIKKYLVKRYEKNNSLLLLTNENINYLNNEIIVPQLIDAVYKELK